MSISRVATGAAILFFLSASVAPASAQAPSPQTLPQTKEQIEQELRESWQAASKIAVYGPKAASLGTVASLQVPDGTAYIPMPEAGRILRALGNNISPKVLGLMAGTGEKDNWLAVVSFHPEGYIRDDDAKDWDADELLQNLKDGTAHDNADRKARGFPELEITGWIERPTYTSPVHQLVWSAGLRDKGARSGADQTVNYNTYLLGREGYLSLNFVTSTAMVETERPLAQKLLAAMQFAPGKRYEDFNESTDKVAAYGLAALVGGAVLKKVGFLAVLAAFAAKFAKVLAVACAAVAAGIFNLVRRKKHGGAKA